jgi:NAD(P)-dependent dehydrogenase (short-subunit alcohol dehydrogenase family)
MNAIVLGGTKGMGRALARLLVTNGHRVFLLGRNLEHLQRSARDLEVRSGSADPVGVALCDLEQPETFTNALDEAVNTLGTVDLVVVTAGLFARQDALEKDLNLAGRLLATNFVNTVLFCEHVRQRVFATRGGVLCVFSSVAGERGRKPVVLYGAAKSGLTRYLEGLDHRFHSTGLRVVCVKPGFVRTSMTQGLPEPPFSGEPELVAVQVLRAIEKGQSVVYAPRMWGLVMLVVRWLPRFVMRRVSF